MTTYFLILSGARVVGLLVKLDVLATPQATEMKCVITRDNG